MKNAALHTGRRNRYLRRAPRRPAPGRIVLAWLGCLLTVATFGLSCQFATAAGSAAVGLHDGWTGLLQACVVEIDSGNSTAADYNCFAQQGSALDRYLATLAGVDRNQFDGMSRDARLAFLINAYNAWTVKLILTAWPDLDSIRDLGSLLRSPWKKDIVTLFDDEISLDDIEHGMIREPGAYDEPRIHFAVNCASIGCPALRREAYVAERLDAQLEEQTAAFLGDPSRNRLRDDRLEVSSLFKWYRGDFEQGWRGADTVGQFLARYATALELDAATTRALAAGELPLSFLDYDWNLNRAPAS